MAAPSRPPPFSFVSRLCPACAQRGRPFKVSTIKDRPAALNVALVCDACRREWTVEQHYEASPRQS
jgi:hypothetical protein